MKSYSIIICTNQKSRSNENLEIQENCKGQTVRFMTQSLSKETAEKAANSRVCFCTFPNKTVWVEINSRENEEYEEGK